MHSWQYQEGTSQRSLPFLNPILLLCLQLCQAACFTSIRKSTQIQLFWSSSPAIKCVQASRLESVPHSNSNRSKRFYSLCCTHHLLHSMEKVNTICHCRSQVPTFVGNANKTAQLLYVQQTIPRPTSQLHALMHQSTFKLLTESWTTDAAELSTVISSHGLSVDRQWYLYDSIRPFLQDQLNS